MAPRRRPRAALRRMRMHRRTILGINELSNVSREFISSRPNWRLIEGPPNSVLRNGEKISNGIAFRSDIYDLQWWTVERVDTPERKRPLFLPIVCLKNKHTGNTIRVICFHAPRRKTEKRGNHKVIRVVIARMRTWRRRGVTAIAIGDGNNGALARMFRAAKMRVLSFGRVEIIVSVNARKRRKARVLKRVRFSDHPVPIASVNT